MTKAAALMLVYEISRAEYRPLREMLRIACDGRHSLASDGFGAIPEGGAEALQHIAALEEWAGGLREFLPQDNKKQARSVLAPLRREATKD